MGDYFKEEKKVEKKDELIRDTKDIFATYDVLINKIQLMKEDSYEAIMPIRTMLMGREEGIEDSGQIGNLRRRLRTSRLSSLPIGTIIWSTLENIENLDRWSERYIDYTDQYFKSYDLITKSAFSMIVILTERINLLSKEKKELAELYQKLEIEFHGQPRIELPSGKNKPMPRGKVDLSVPPEIDVFQELFRKKIDEYRKAKKSGDEGQMYEAARQAYAICSRDKAKIKIIEEKLAEIDSMPPLDDKN